MLELVYGRPVGIRTYLLQSESECQTHYGLFVALHVEVPYQSYGNCYQSEVEYNVDDRKGI